MFETFSLIFVASEIYHRNYVTYFWYLKISRLTQIINIFWVFVTNFIFFYFSCTVDGLPLNEFRVLAEKATSSPEYRDEKNRRVEFAVPTFNVLNALEQMGYKVIHHYLLKKQHGNWLHDRYCMIFRLCLRFIFSMFTNYIS